MKRHSFALALALLASPAFAADLSAQSLPVKAANANAQSGCTAGNCSGFFLEFGAGMDAALAAQFTGSGGNNGASLNVGGGYQFWQGQVIAGMEFTGGYQFGTAGSVGTFTSTQFAKLGYNFFPSGATGTPTPAQNPFLNSVPANLLANSTPYILLGGAYGHGIEKGAAGVGVDTVIAANWSTALEWYNAPSFRNQPDENVFRIMVQRHF